MATLYPNGYSGNPAGTGDMRTIEGVQQRTTVQRLHPEFWRRVRAMMTFAASQGVMLGVGTGWRVQPTNPDGSCKPGFACPGNSYHEGFMPDGVSKPDGVHDRNAMACDMVLDSSWGWMGANCHLFGIVDFSDVNSEPWHIQPVEIPRSRNRATAQPPLTTWTLPGTPDGGLFVTPTDKTELITILRAEVPKMIIDNVGDAKIDPFGTIGGGPLGAVLQEARLGTRTIGPIDTKTKEAITANNPVLVQAVSDALNSAGFQQMIQATVTAAVTAALQDVTVDADLDEAEVQEIAEAVAVEQAERLVD